MGGPPSECADISNKFYMRLRHTGVLGRGGWGVGEEAR